MFRFLTFTTLIAGALLLTFGTAQAQDEDRPVAGPDEIIFVGEVPAPPGTEIRAEYLFNEPVVCGTTTADKNSQFVIRIDAECALGGTGPLICWGEGLEACQGFPSAPRPGADRPEGGDTIDLGPLVANADREVVGDSTPPQGGSGIILPSVGTAAGSDDNHKGMWLAIGLFLAAALVAGAGSLVLRQRSGAGPSL